MKGKIYSLYIVYIHCIYSLSTIINVTPTIQYACINCLSFNKIATDYFFTSIVKRGKPLIIFLYKYSQAR